MPLGSPQKPEKIHPTTSRQKSMYCLQWNDMERLFFKKTATTLETSAVGRYISPIISILVGILLKIMAEGL